MADLKNKYIDNVDGKYYVDQDCIYCGLCVKIAPNNFCLSPKKDHDVVFKQPENQQEIDDCEEALHCCPVEAIGSDGIK